MKLKKLIALLGACCLMGSGALGESTAVPDAVPSLTEGGVTLSGGSVSYPKVEGMTDAALQETVNARILAVGDVTARLNRLAVLGSSAVGLNVSWTGGIAGNVLSVVFSAEGAVTEERATHVWSAANVDLLSGQDITLNDLFTDVEAAQGAMEELLQFDVAPALSAHLQNSDLTPLPETFGLNAAGITFYYPLRQLSTLSDRAGAVTLRWYELRDYLRTGANTVADRIGATDMMTLTPGSADRIREAVAQGAFPGLPLTVGASVAEAVAAYHLLADPDLYEDGRMLQLEEAALRDTWLLTDRLTDTWDSSVIQGVRTEKDNFCGLCTGETTQAQWRAVLGQPDAEVAVDEASAEAYRLVPGNSDYYQMGEYRLRLHADADGVLSSMTITE